MGDSGRRLSDEFLSTGELKEANMADASFSVVFNLFLSKSKAQNLHKNLHLLTFCYMFSQLLSLYINDKHLYHLFDISVLFSSQQ